VIEIRSVEGRLLCKVAEDFSMIEIVQRRRRYTVQRGWETAVHAVIIAYVDEDEAPPGAQGETIDAQPFQSE